MVVHFFVKILEVLIYFNLAPTYGKCLLGAGQAHIDMLSAGRVNTTGRTGLYAMK